MLWDRLQTGDPVAPPEPETIVELKAPLTRHSGEFQQTAK